jgi:hypothetical protein
MKGTIIIEIEGQDQYELEEKITKYELIFRLLIEKGALDGVKGGSANIHFGSQGEFMGIELSYWPYKVRKNLSTGLER